VAPLAEPACPTAAAMSTPRAQARCPPLFASPMQAGLYASGNALPSVACRPWRADVSSRFLTHGRPMRSSALRSKPKCSVRSSSDAAGLTRSAIAVEPTRSVIRTATVSGRSCDNHPPFRRLAQPSQAPPLRTAHRPAFGKTATREGSTPLQRKRAPRWPDPGLSLRTRPTRPRADARHARLDQGKGAVCARMVCPVEGRPMRGLVTRPRMRRSRVKARAAQRRLPDGTVLRSACSALNAHRFCDELGASPILAERIGSS